MDGPHEHLWSLPDGTGLHAPFGLLLHDEDDRICCHLCGRWFAALGPHLRRHRWTARAYREAMGLGSRTPLVARRVSASLSLRQRGAYEQEVEVRKRFAAGQEMARDGRLAQRARAALAGPVPAERVRVRRAALAAGRDTRARRRAEALSRTLTTEGVETLGDLLRREYAAGASLQALAARTGLGRTRLRRSLVEAGVEVRPTGINTAEGRRSRAEAADAAAAARVGATDIVDWLAERYAEGWTLTRLARAVGHSSHWVRWRLERRGPTVRG